MAVISDPSTPSSTPQTPAPKDDSFFRVDAPGDSGYEQYEYIQRGDSWQKSGIKGAAQTDLGQATPEEIRQFLTEAKPKADASGAIQVAGSGENPFAYLIPKAPVSPDSAPVPEKPGANVSADAAATSGVDNPAPAIDKNNPFAYLVPKADQSDTPKPSLGERVETAVDKAVDLTKTRLPELERMAKVGTEPMIAAAQKELARRGEQVKARLKGERGEDADVDYDAGLTFFDRVNLDKADNDDERMAYLEQRYGAENIGQDKRGRLYVKQDGKKVAVEGGGRLSGAGASLLAQAAPLAGMGVGAAMGAPAGPLGMAVGAGVGAMGGKGLDEVTKIARGTHRKSMSEEAAALGKEGLMGMAGEGAGQLITKGVGRLTKGPLPHFATGTTPESREMTALALRGGAVPPSVSALPDFKVGKWRQALSQKTVGPFAAQEEANARFIENEMRNVLRESGVPESEINSVFEHIADPKSALSTRALGEDLGASVRAHTEALTRVTETELKNADNLLDQQMRQLDALINRHAVGDLGVDVAGGVRQARADFGTAHTKAYKRIDRLVGGQPLVPTSVMRRAAQRIIDRLPMTEGAPAVEAGTRRVQVDTPRGQIWRNEEVPGRPAGSGRPVGGYPSIFHEIAALPDSVSFGEMQRIRTRLLEEADSKNLTRGTVEHDYGELNAMSNVAFTMAADNPAAAPAVRLLRATDRSYAQGVKKFKDVTVKQLAKMADAGMAPDASKVAEIISRAGRDSEAKLSGILGMLPQETRVRIAAADFNNIISNATIGGEVTADGLKREIKRRGDRLMSTLYGPRMSEISSMIDNLAARDGSMPVGDITPSTFRSTLERAVSATEQLDKFMKENYFSALADPARLPEKALSWIVRPGEETRLIKAVEFFGENSPQVAALRTAALQDLLSRAIVNTESGLGRAIAGEGIEGALRQLTTRQQEILFPNGLADDIRLLAKEAKFLFPESTADMAAGMAAGAILSTPVPVRWVAQFWAGSWGWLLSKPTVVRALALGLEGDGKARMITREAFANILRGTTTTSVPETPHAKPGRDKSSSLGMPDGSRTIAMNDEPTTTQQAKSPQGRVTITPEMADRNNPKMPSGDPMKMRQNSGDIDDLEQARKMNDLSDTAYRT